MVMVVTVVILLFPERLIVRRLRSRCTLHRNMCRYWLGDRSDQLTWFESFIALWEIIHYFPWKS